MKLMPASSARFMIANDVASSQPTWYIIDFSSASPNVIAPRQSGDTFTPVLPRLRYSMRPASRRRERESRRALLEGTPPAGSFLIAGQRDALAARAHQLRAVIPHVRDQRARRQLLLVTLSPRLIPEKPIDDRARVLFGPPVDASREEAEEA